MTTTINIEDQLSAIQASLASVQEELSIIRKTRDEIQDLKEDLSIVVKDMFQTLVLEMEELSPHLHDGELIDLLKRASRNIGNFNKLLMQMESVQDFISDATPIGKEAFSETLKQLHELENKGYFDYAKEFSGIVENVTDNFSPADVRQLADNIVLILQTVKNLTQPDMLTAVNNAATIFKHLDPTQIEEYSLLRVLKEVNSHEMRRAWGLFYTFLKNLSQIPEEPKSITTNN